MGFCGCVQQLHVGAKVSILILGLLVLCDHMYYSAVEVINFLEGTVKNIRGELNAQHIGLCDLLVKHQADVAENFLPRHQCLQLPNHESHHLGLRFRERAMLLAEISNRFVCKSTPGRKQTLSNLHETFALRVEASDKNDARITHLSASNVSHSVGKADVFKAWHPAVLIFG